MKKEVGFVHHEFAMYPKIELREAMPNYLFIRL